MTDKLESFTSYEVVELGPDPQGRDVLPSKNGDVLRQVVYTASGPIPYQEHVSLNPDGVRTPTSSVPIEVIGMKLPGTGRLLYGMVHERDARASALRLGLLYGHSPQAHPLFPDVHWYVGTREELTPICATFMDPVVKTA